MPTCWIIAGPNGAGKTTFALEYLPQVAQCLAHGGHDIPVADIERRFARSLYNVLNTFSAQVDACRCFMNSNATPELVFEQQGDVRNVAHNQHYQHLLKEALQ